MSQLADLLEARQDELLQRWMGVVRSNLELPVPVPDSELANSMPDYLQQLVQMLRHDPTHDRFSDSSKSHVAKEHGRQRYRLGFKLDEVVREYGVLRGLIFDLIEESGLQLSLIEVRGLSDFIATGIADGVRQYMEDREAAYQAQAERDAAELTAVLEAIPDAFYVGDLSGVKYANRRAFELLGYPTLEALNRNIETLSDELNIRDAATGERVPLEQLTYARALKGESISAEVLVRHRQRGEDVYLQSSGAPVWLAGRIVSAVVINSDITDRKRLEAERHKREQLEQQLIGIVSHDLRNPLSAILLQSSTLLRHEPLDDRTRKGLDRIHSTVNRALRLIADLLDFTQARLSGEVPVNPSMIDFDDQIKRAVEDLQLSQRERTIALEQHSSGKGEWDPDRLTQIVSNLVVNALQYSPPDTPITVRTRGEQGEVVLEVHNVGTPIPEEMIGSLFEPLKRATDQKNVQRSVGLGLYIVDQLVRAHGGKVRVTSSAEVGTTFAIWLPRRRERGPGPDPDRHQ